MCIFFNFSLFKSSVPDSWKEANVTPILKKDDPSEVSNYRALSLSNTIGIFFKFLSVNNLIACLKSGFVPGDPTESHLVSKHDTFCKPLNEGK